MDEHAALILSDARQFGLGMLISSQFPHQLDEGVRKEINTNTSIKFMGQIEYAVAAQYARDMFTTPEFIMGMKSHDRSHAEWAAYVANMTDRGAVRVRMPFGAVEAMPKRAKAARAETAPIPPAPAPREPERRPAAQPVSSDESVDLIGTKDPFSRRSRCTRRAGAQ
jgi:hypothetical protein